MAEIQIGSFPDRGGEGYSEFLPIPLMNDVLDVVEQLGALQADIVIVGKVYFGSEKIGGDTRHLGNTEDLYKLLSDYERYYRDPQAGDHEEATVTIIQELFGYDNPPPHITGIVIRTVD